MKLPKEIKRFCAHCKKHTIHKVKEEKNRGKNKTHPMTKGSKLRLILRGRITGFGNSGSFSRGAVNSWKRSNKKRSKKIDLRFTCTECSKSSTKRGGSFRAKKIEFQ